MDNGWAKIALLIALSAASLALFGLFQQYYPAGPNLLRNADFAAGLSEWRVGDQGARPALSDGIATLRSARAEARPQLFQIIDNLAGIGFIGVRAKVRHAGVGRGVLPWHGARIVLVQVAADGTRLWELPHAVIGAGGDADWHSVRTTFAVSRRAASAELRIEIVGVTGEIAVRGLRVHAAREGEGFELVRFTLILAWLVAWVWVVGALLSEPRNRPRHLFAMALAIVIVAGSMIPNEAKFEVRQVFNTLLHADVDAMPTQTQTQTPAPAPPGGAAEAPSRLLWYATQKGGHVGLFAVLAVAVFWSRPMTPAWRLCGTLLGFGAIAEILQLFAVDRSAQWADVGLNALGIAIGIAIALIARTWLWRRADA